ncbi:MAG: hypothetical protein C4554_04765 [Dethiobacter sp.]|jgi:hypothetical protein|nr:MAG: hypothetical protein C4554_04765 [Dethiobacter sp.]
MEGKKHCEVINMIDSLAKKSAPLNNAAEPDFTKRRNAIKSRYRLAPEVRAVADNIIASFHPHLQEATIAYLLRRGTWKSRGCVVTGKAIAAPEQWRFLSGCDLALIINETVWQVLGDKGREVLLDHELSHFTPPPPTKAAPCAGPSGSMTCRNSARW